MKKLTSFPIVVLLLLTCTTGGSYTVNAQAHNIKNDVFWYTKDGRPINSQGGGIFRFPDPATGEKKYYWYGVHYKEADTYRNDPSLTLPSATFESVTCYSSTDLVNWKFESDVLTQEELKKKDGERRTWVGRLGVAYIKELKLYEIQRIESYSEGVKKRIYDLTVRATKCLEDNEEDLAKTLLAESLKLQEETSFD